LVTHSLLDSTFYNYALPNLIQEIKLKNLGILSLAVVSVLSSLNVNATGDGYQAESDFFGEAPVVLTVSRMHKPLDESPASVSIIDRQMIRNSGARQLADVFRMVPGFIVGYYSGNEPQVIYQGLGHRYQRQMQVLIDGRSVFIPSFGGVPWTNLPVLLEDIERIEITRGPNAVTYGANAFLATINIITRHAAEDVGGEVIVTEAIDRDNSASDFYVRYGNNYGDLDWRISAGREKDDGYDDVNDSSTLEKFNIRTDFLSNYNQFWTIQAGLNHTIAGRGDGRVTNQYRDEDATNSYQNIKWEIVGDNSSTTARLTHTEQNVTDNFLTPPLNAYLAENLNNNIFLSLPDFNTEVNFDRDSDRLDFEIFQTRNLSPQSQMVYGGSLRKDQVTAKNLFNDDKTHSVDTQRLFSSFEWKSEDGYILDIGAMLEDTTLTDSAISLRLSVLKKLENHRLRLVSSSAKRNPILWEMIGETQYVVEVPPPLNVSYPIVTWRAYGDIEPETINSTEVGLFSEYFDRQLTTDAKLFRYKISDLMNDQDVTLSPDPVTGYDQTFSIPVNGGNIIVNGLDFSLNFSPQHKRYRLYGGLSVVDVKESFDDFKDSYPKYTDYLGGNYNFNQRHQISGTLYVVDEMSWSDTQRKIPKYEKLDLRYQYNILPRNDLNLELIGLNLLDDYSDYHPSQIHTSSYLLRISGKF
jgi:iron complex outermembrane recepter protein